MKATLCRLVPILVIVLFAGSCAAPIALKPLDPALIATVSAGCQRPFLREPFRLVHALEFDLPGGKKGAAVGVLKADPRTRTFRTILMTLEGWVLFDIESGETLTVHRAVPPFDSPAFAQRMAEDIGLAFFSPGTSPLAWGREEGGAPVCRFGRIDGGFVDVLKAGGGAMGIRLYDAGQELRKTVIIPSFNDAGLAEQLEIRSGGGPSYTLRLRLIEGEAIAREQGPSSGESTPKGPNE
jgi:hypothetical protein